MKKRMVVFFLSGIFLLSACNGSTISEEEYNSLEEGMTLPRGCSIFVGGKGERTSSNGYIDVTYDGDGEETGEIDFAATIFREG
ncbi:hypothetical protein AAHB65_27745 [Bacillus toyonensis]